MTDYIKYEVVNAFWIKLWSAHAFSIYFHIMATGGHFGFPNFAKIDRILPLLVINGSVKYEFDMRIGVAVYVKHKPWCAAAAATAVQTASRPKL